MTSLERLLIAVVVLTLALFGVYRWGYANGIDTEKASWEKKERAYKDAESKLKDEHMKDIQRVLDANHQTNLKNHHAYELSIREKDTALAAARAESRRNGGLRFTASCSPAVGQTEAKGTITHHESTTATIALPELVEERLWTLVGEADEVSEQLRSCQAWIKDNGMY